MHVETNRDSYIDAAHLYYAGRISLEEAAARESELARRERRFSASPELNRLLRIFAWLAFPIAIILSAIGGKENRSS